MSWVKVKHTTLLSNGVVLEKGDLIEASYLREQDRDYREALQEVEDYLNYKDFENDTESNHTERPPRQR